MKRITGHLTFRVLVAILLGALLGAFFPKVGEAMKPVGETFINLIKMIIVPIIFLTVVLGIGSIGNMKKVGRVGGKALLYFELITLFALIIGVVIANWVRPGEGTDTGGVTAKAADTVKYVEQAEHMDWVAFLTHIVPPNVFGAFAEGDVLQVLFFSVLFGLALSKMGAYGQPLIQSFERFSKVLFALLGMIMKLAPLGAFGGMAFTIGKYGLHSLIQLGKLMGTVYATMFFFIFVVLGLVAWVYKFSLWRYLVFIREEILIVLGTSSSESALPRMIDKMERIGCSRTVSSLVIPTGYSFNLDGTTIYLAIATIFLAQAFQVNLSFGQELSIIGILMLTSKGAAAVTGGGFIVLASTLTATKVIPVEGLALLLGVDRFMSEARAITNLIGNGVATIVVAKSEREFDEERYQRAITGQEEPATVDVTE